MSDEVKWTKEQKLAINQKGNNILVAAAAGSGKTAVLVERIIQKIIKDHVDIDKLLVVTFTNAAASEMRERVLSSLYKELDNNPDDETIKRQILLLGKSNICTIHSFCLDIIRNYFYEIDLPANFKIASKEEMEILKQEALEDLLDSLYEKEDASFMKLVDNYASYKDDDKIKNLVNKVYDFIQSNPFPLEWLNEKMDYFKKQDDEEDYSKSIYGKILVSNLNDTIHDAIFNLKALKREAEKVPELVNTNTSLGLDIDELTKFFDALNISWDQAYSLKNEKKFSLPRWKSDSGIELCDIIKKKRGSIKDKVEGEINSIVKYPSNISYKDNYAMYDLLVCLKDLIIKYDLEIKKRKKDKNIIDFNDIEHYALQILVKKDENGNYNPTEVAKSYKDRFEEIAIDEYQDSNQVQEYILSTISNGNNIFMVGDVKQSIYRFRQACPDLFMQKYNSYENITNKTEEELSAIEDNNGKIIQLFNNFRSRENIIDFVNTIFDNLMGEKFGELNYTKKEFLNYGFTDYPQEENSFSDKDLSKTEFMLIEANNDEEENEDDIFSLKINEEDEENEDEINDLLEMLEQEEIEALLVSNKINEIINSKIKVYDKDKKILRPVQYKDIIILLRTTKNVAPIFEKALNKNNIPVYCDANNEYLETYEIQTILSVLKIIDNPLNDISLVTAMRSQIGGFDDNELLEIRLCEKNGYYYNSLIKAKEQLDGNIKNKIIAFTDFIDDLRQKVKYKSIAELVWDIFTYTGFYNYVSLMPNGIIRKNNLKKLFEMAKMFESANFKGLYSFIKYIEKIKDSSGDLSSAKVIGENDDVVRIMSIHKSKGLEFPIVFLSNSNRKFNEQDLKEVILLNQNYGLGPEYIDNKRKIKYSTSSKDAIKIVNRKESLAEELRVLYVALTRAREKLYITGIIKNSFKDFINKKELLNIYHRVDEKINPILIRKFKNYLDWLLLVYATDRLNEQVSMTIVNKKDIVLSKVDDKKDVNQFDFNRKIDVDKIKQELCFDYPNKELITTPIKSTVSKIKQMDNEKVEAKLVDLNDNDVTTIDLNDSLKQINDNIIDISNNLPQFMKTNSKLTGAQKGTIIHYILQKLDFSKEYSEQDLNIFVQELIDNNSFTSEQISQINLQQIRTFLNDDIAKEIKNSNKVFKEKPFVTKYLIDDNYILVQGIIDLFYQNQNGEWILLDYKTDYVSDGDINMLVQRYHKQLDIYKKALEDIIHDKVAHTYIYSLNLGKKVEL